MTPRQQSPSAIRAEWATWRARIRRMGPNVVARRGDDYRDWCRYTGMRFDCARDYADARALRRYLCAVGDNE